MSLTLESFVAGRYSALYGGTDVGITNEGYELQQESSWESIDRSDAYGDSIIDGVFRGGNCYIGFEAKAFKQGSVSPFWPWGSNVSGPSGASNLGVMQAFTGIPSGEVLPSAGISPLGTLASDLANSEGGLILSAVTGTAYDTAGALIITQLTASGAILAPNVPQRLLFHTRLRQVPIRLICLPYLHIANSNTFIVWFTFS